MTVSYFYSLLGAVAAVASVLLLRYSWQLRRQGRARSFILWFAWAFLCGSAAMWVTASTPDWGIAVALCIFMMGGVAAMIWIVAQEPRRKAIESGKNRRVAVADASKDRRRIFLRRLGVFLIAGPGAGAASLLLTLWLYGITFNNDGSQSANQLFLALFSFPVFWAILTLVATYDMPLIKRSSVILLSAIVGLIGSYSVL